MPCEHYKDALIEVAASGARPQGGLRAHLEECALCRVAFDEEQSLFAAMDSGLHAAVNTEVPPSLLPCVRAGLNKSEAQRPRWVSPLVFASASVALVFLFLSMLQPHQRAVVNVAKKSPVVVPNAKQPGTDINSNSEKVLPPNGQIASIRTSHSHSARNSTNAHSTASSNLEVLVPPDEREAFVQFVAVLNERTGVATSLLPKTPERKDEDGLSIVDPVRIPEIEIKPLDGTETEASDGSGVKH